MKQHADILDEQEALGRPLKRSLALHVGVLALLIFYTWWDSRGHVRFGDPSAMGGAIGITAVSSIPLPHRAGAVNPVANDTDSQVPAEVKKAKPAKRAVRDDRDAIALHPKKKKKEREELVASTRYRVPGSEKPNQIYSSKGAAVQSPLYGGSAGSGGTGIGNRVFGDRLGWYAQLLQQTIANKWADQTASLGSATSRRVTLTFDIQRDGSIRNVKVLESSGNTQVDFAAQRAVLAASPVRRLPEDFERNVANVEYHFQLQR